MHNHDDKYLPRSGFEPGTSRLQAPVGGGPRVVASTAAFHARVRSSVSGLGAQYHGQHCTLHSFEHFGALHMHNHDDKYPPRPGFEPGTSRLQSPVGEGPRVVASTSAFPARVRGSGPGGSEETIMFLPHPRVKLSIVGSFRDREVAFSASDRQGSNFESCVWRTVSFHSAHHSQDVLLAQFSLYVYKGGLMPDLFHFIYKPESIQMSHRGRQRCK